MSTGTWIGVIVGIVAVVATLAILVATATPRDPSAQALLYVSGGYGGSFRVVKEERDSKFHEGYPDKYQVTVVATTGAGGTGPDTGEPFRVTVVYKDGRVRLSDGGHCWSSDFCRGEAKAFLAAAGQAVQRPLAAVKIRPRSEFSTNEEIAAWGPFATDTEMGFEVDLVVFGSAEADGDAVRTMLAAWLPRWKHARKARILVAYCGDRRKQVDEPYKGTGYGWRHNTDTLWTIELHGAEIGGATAASLQAATDIRHPAQEVEDEKDESK